MKSFHSRTQLDEVEVIIKIVKLFFNAHYCLGSCDEILQEIKKLPRCYSVPLIGYSKLLESLKQSLIQNQVIKEWPFALGELTSFSLPCLSYVEQPTFLQVEEKIKRHVVCLAMIEQSWNHYGNSFDMKFIDDEVLRLVLLKGGNPCMYQYSSELVTSDFTFLCAVLSRNQEKVPVEDIFMFTSNSIKSNKKQVLYLLNSMFNVYNQISEALKSDIEIIEVTLDKCGRCLSSSLFPTQVFKTFDRRIALKASKIVCGFLEFASKEFQNDIEIVCNAISIDPVQYQFASEELRNNFEVTEYAVTKMGVLLEFASKSLKENKHIVIAALRESIFAVDFMDKSLLDNLEIMANVLESIPSYYPMAGDTVKQNIDIIKLVLSYNGNLLKFIPQELKNDKSIVELAVSTTPNAIFYAHESFLNDKKFVYDACAKHPSLIFKLPDTYKNDIELFYSVIHHRLAPTVISYASENVRNQYDLMLQYCKNSKFNLAFIGNELKKNKEFWRTIIKEHKDAIMFLPAELANDDELVLESVSRFGFINK